MGGVGFCNDEASAGFLVQTMDDAGAFLSADHAKARAMKKQGIDQCALGVSGPGMDDQAGWLVENQKRRVLPQDLQRNVLRFCDCGFDFVGDCHADFVPRTECLGGPGRRTVHEHEPTSNKILEPHAGEIRQQRSEMPVQPESHPRIAHNPCFAIHSGFCIAGFMAAG